MTPFYKEHLVIQNAGSDRRDIDGYVSLDKVPSLLFQRRKIESKTEALLKRRNYQLPTVMNEKFDKLSRALELKSTEFDYTF